MSGTSAESMETFSPEDLEALTLETEDLKEIAEQIEDESLEDLEDLEFSAEGAQQEALPLVLLGKFAARYILKLLMKLAQREILRFAANAKLKKKLQEIVNVQKGGRPAFIRLMCDAICTNVPPAVKPLCRKFCPVVCARIAPIAARKLGLSF